MWLTTRYSERCALESLVLWRMDFTHRNHGHIAIGSGAGVIVASGAERYFISSVDSDHAAWRFRAVLTLIAFHRARKHVNAEQGAGRQPLTAGLFRASRLRVCIFVWHSLSASIRGVSARRSSTHPPSPNTPPSSDTSPEGCGR